MRKNFTQLFMGLALVLGFTTMSYAQCDIPAPAGSFFNYQFDGGLEGWRSLDAAGFETTLGWGWNETGDLTEGSFNQPGQDNIVSASVCNGAAIMNSDLLDNGGMGADFIGLGPCPSDCNGYLVSPVMDLSTVTSEEVELQFTQALRHFDSEYFIYVSIDGGATNRDTVVMNADFATFQFENSVRTIPLCGIAGETDVVITFHYQADYYFWAIDDVSILPANTGVDMRVNKNFYSKVANYVTPSNMGTEHAILADIENLRAYESPPSTLNYTVKDEAGAVIFTASRDYGPVPGCSTDENKVFQNDNFTMPSIEGDYTIEFEIDVEGDDTPSNDIVSAPFRMGDNEFRKLPTQEEYGSAYLSGVRYGDSFLSWGSYFHVPQNEDELVIESVSLGIILSNGEPSAGFINVAVYQWFDIDDIGAVNDGERVLLGEVDVLVEPGSPGFNQYTVTPLDGDGKMIEIEPGAELLVLGHSNPFNGVTNYFFNAVADVGFEEYSPGATNLGHREKGLIGGYGSFASGDAASHDDRHTTRELFNIDGSWIYDVSMNIGTGSVGTEDINESLSVSIFPSPASTKVNVDLNLEEVSDKVSVELMDLAGNKVGTYNYSNIKKDRLTIDVSTLPGGMYLMNVRTEAGMTSKRISVIH